MRLYNATMRINRLEMLKAQIGQDIVKSGINVNDDINKKLKSDALNEYKRQAGILGKNVSKPDISKLTRIIAGQTGDASFSDRIWQDNAALNSELDVLLTRQMIRGLSPVEIARDLRKQVNDQVNSSKYAAERIARTESARVQTKVQLDSFNKYDINYYCQWIAEPTACQTCTDIAENDDGLGDGVYSTTEVPDLPAHPNCRCSLSAYEPDEAQLEAKGIKFGNIDLVNPQLDSDAVDSITKSDVGRAFVEYAKTTNRDFIDMYHTRKLKAQYELAKEFNYDALPIVVDDEAFKDVNDNSIIYRSTNRGDSLLNGELEFSSFNKSIFGSGIYFANSYAEAAKYLRFNNSYKIYRATLKDDAVIVDLDYLKNKTNELLTEEQSHALHGDHIYDLIAMVNGIDVIYSNGGNSIVILNRGKLVINNENKQT